MNRVRNMVKAALLVLVLTMAGAAFFASQAVAEGSCPSGSGSCVVIDDNEIQAFGGYKGKIDVTK